MSSRLGPVGLTLGVILIGVATFVTASTDPPVQSAAHMSSTAFSTGFVVWSSVGLLGLLIGLVASRRVRPAPSSIVSPRESVATSSRTAAAASVPGRFGIAFEPVEDSA